MMAAVVLASCGKGKDQEVQPKRQAITETVFASGQLDARDRYNLTAQSEGYLVELNVEESDSVRNGQVLAVINNITNEANSAAAAQQLAIAEFNLSANAPALKEAAAKLELAESKLAQENKQLNRFKELHKQGSVSDLDLENAQLSYTSAETNVKSAKERLNLLKQQAKQAEINQRAQQEISQSNRDYNQLSALSNGTIIKRHKQRGDYVRKGDVILTIANEATVLAKLNVDENSIGKVQVGMPVKVRLNTLKDQLLDATVSLIYPMFDEASQSFICEVVFTGAIPFTIVGTQLEANIIVGEKDNVLLIPRSYLSFTNTVHVKGEDDPRAVKVGILSTEWVEIVDGLSESDVLLPLKK